MTGEGQAARDALWRMTNAYQLSQAIHVAATLGIADLVRDGPRSVEELAAATGAHGPALYRLLRALAGAGIFREAEGRFGQTPLSEPLRADAPGSLRAWAMYVGRPSTWSAWGQLLHSVQTGEAAFPWLHGVSAWEYRAPRPEEAAIFDAAMSALSAAAVAAVVRAYDFSRFGVLMDVGGGAGALLAGILAAHPRLRGILFDLPHVAAGAPATLERAGVADRCAVVAGSFFERVPAGADAHILKSVIHDWDDAQAAAILRACRAALGAAGRVLLVERVVGPENAPDAAKLTDLHMLVMHAGRERTAADFGALCAAAGLRVTNIVATDSPYSIVEAVPA